MSNDHRDRDWLLCERGGSTLSSQNDVLFGAFKQRKERRAIPA
ncbi:hypothetical protein PM3_1111 [Pasteurella multocida]|nr:hypothetical protein PM3_1111 [Pasteurella multocida]